MKLVILGNIQSIHVQRWALAFKKRGYEVHVVSQQPANKKFEFDVRQLTVSSEMGYLLNIPHVFKIISDLKPDIIHVHYAGGYGLLARLAGIKNMVLTCYGSEIFDAPERSIFLKKQIKKNLKSAKYITSSSLMMIKGIEDLAGIDGNTFHVPFGVETGLFKPALIPKKNSVIKIGSNKHLTEKYGIDGLIDAFHIIQTNNNTIDVELHLAGEGNDEKNLKKKVEHLKSENKIFFHSAIEHGQMPEFLNNLDIYCAPSRFDSETFGVSILEASACELPVIVSNAGGLKEVCKHGVTGLIVEKNDVEQLAAAIQNLIDSEEDRINFGKNGRKFVQENYEWEKCVNQMEEIYKLFF